MQIYYQLYKETMSSVCVLRVLQMMMTYTLQLLL